MGLENGIAIKNVEELPKFAKEDGVVVYWRKCWNLRDAVLDVIDPKRVYKEDRKIDAEDIPAIVRAIIPFLSKDHWKDKNQTIWEFEEMLDILLKDVENLIRLEVWLEEHQEAEVEFFDSY